MSTGAGGFPPPHQQGPGPAGHGGPAGGGFPPPAGHAAPGHAPAGTQPADIGRRIGGGILDYLLMAVLFVIFTALFGENQVGDSGFSFNLTGLPFLLYLLVQLAYFFVMEVTTGRTLGKMALGTRVVTTEGGQANAGQIAIRTLLRLVDVSFCALVGIIAIAATGRNQRLGDLAGSTLVVRA